MTKEAGSARGIVLMLTAVFIFAIQDAISRHLAQTYNVWFVLMIRFWVMVPTLLLLTARRGVDLRCALRSHFPKLQFLRTSVLTVQTFLIVICFTNLGLINTHAIFAANPLIVAALSGPLLGEKLGWRRWSAIAVGFVGVLIILQPGAGVFSPLALLALACATLFALYSVLTRYVSRKDSAQVSLFWAGVSGAVILTPPGLMNIEPMAWQDMPFMATLCLTGMLAHWLMIKALESAEASTVQPFAYAQLIFISTLGVTVFNEELRPSVVIGTVVVIAAGIFTIWRTAQVAKAAAPLQGKGK